MVKNYKQVNLNYKFVHQFTATHPETEEEIVFNFKANVETFALFKSITGKDLAEELDLHQKRQAQLAVANDTTKLYEFMALDKDKQAEAYSQNKEGVLSALSGTFKQANEHILYEDTDISFDEAVIMSMYISALPEDEKTEAIGYGKDCLIDEVYQDPFLFIELIHSLLKCRDEVKKKGLI